MNIYLINYRYNKTEGIENDIDAIRFSNFTHIILEAGKEQLVQKTLLFFKLFEVESFDKVEWKRTWNFLYIANLKFSSRLVVYQKNTF